MTNVNKLRFAAAAGAALLSTIAVTDVSGQSFSEPAAFQAQHPDRDVLNGGALTPAGRASAGLDGRRSAFGAMESSTRLIGSTANPILSTSRRSISRHKRSGH